ncbi:dicarboxylate/amino acid:cation symporter [Acidaminobacter sp. JC074]|uniref:dicarboxylate/amino acid:cation symporter n=1 Tax=Acidaminobacter sp. JC074 TaxID=2530199 RepID=UPI001F0D3470|nr:dicarboxylate/amino acid:cation symporter [Acidaminobacter sp. JC074]MCH4891256.1 dicarboxylate/amino acid:cation symporter [Acidaminobacter sp. JC074]
MKEKKMGLSTKIFIGLILGIITGLLMYVVKGQAGETSSIAGIIDNFFIGFVFELIGGIFVNAIRMMIVPLVFVSLTLGAASIGDIKKLGRIGGKTVGFYLVTTAIAISIAILIATVVQPGVGTAISLEGLEYTPKEAPSIASVFVDMVPRNPIAAMASGNMLQIIVFALLTGSALTILGDRTAKITALFEEANVLVLKLVEMIMLVAPIGVFALIAKTMATLGWAMMPKLIMYMLCVVGALLIHAVFTYQGILYMFTKLSPIQFFKNFYPAMTVAFSTASSSATLPVTIETAEKRLGVSPKIASFCLPLGATINMDGTAIMQGVATVFIAQLFGIDLGLMDFVTVIVTATLASIGTAGVPGVGLLMLSMVLVQVGLPVEGIAIIIGIDRILDMLRTAINITGDACCTVIVAKGEGEFNEKVYYEDSDVKDNEAAA